MILGYFHFSKLCCRSDFFTLVNLTSRNMMSWSSFTFCSAVLRALGKRSRSLPVSVAPANVRWFNFSCLILSVAYHNKTHHSGGVDQHVMLFNWWPFCSSFDKNNKDNSKRNHGGEWVVSRLQRIWRWTNLVIEKEMCVLTNGDCFFNFQNKLIFPPDLPFSFSDLCIKRGHKS